MWLKDELKNMFSAKYWQDPQRLALAHNAVENIWMGLVELEKMGEQLKVVPKTPEDVPPPVEYPKMLYSRDGTVIVNSPDEEGKMADEGWVTHPSAEAKVVPTAKPSSPPPEPPPTFSVGRDSPVPYAPPAPVEAPPPEPISPPPSPEEASPPNPLSKKLADMPTPSKADAPSAPSKKD